MKAVASTASGLVAALLGALLAAPARGVRLVDSPTYQACKASTACTSLCAIRARPDRAASGHRLARAALRARTRC